MAFLARIRGSNISNGVALDTSSIMTTSKPSKSFSVNVRSFSLQVMATRLQLSTNGFSNSLQSFSTLFSGSFRISCQRENKGIKSWFSVCRVCSLLSNVFKRLCCVANSAKKSASAENPPSISICAACCFFRRPRSVI